MSAVVALEEHPNDPNPGEKVVRALLKNLNLAEKQAPVHLPSQRPPHALSKERQTNRRC
jgi:hypothetical protein